MSLAASIGSFLRSVMGIRPAKELPWAQDAWDAIQTGCRFNVEPNDTGQSRLALGKIASWRLTNNKVSIFYSKNHVRGELRETLDILIPPPKHGGMVVRFVDGEAVNWNRSFATGLYEVPDREKYWYLKVLEEVRRLT